MQKIVFVAVLAVAIASVVAIPQAPGALDAAEIGGKLFCGPNGILSPNPETTEKMGACKDPNVWGTEPGKKNPNCEGTCIAEVLGYLGDDGKMDKTKYFKWIDVDFSKHGDFAKKHMEQCFTKHGEKIDLNDESCSEIKNFDSCGWAMQPKLTCP